jgi:hypothetical protein
MNGYLYKYKTFYSDAYKNKWGELEDFYQNNLENMKQKYSFLKGLSKGILSFVLFLLPVLLTNFPAYMDLTIGAVLVMILNFLKVSCKSI